MTTVYISKDVEVEVEVALRYEELSDLCLELSDDEQAKLGRMLLEDAPLPSHIQYLADQAQIACQNISLPHQLRELLMALIGKDFT